MTLDDVKVLIDRTLENDQKATPGPWRECSASPEAGCSCGLVWSVPVDVPIMASHDGAYTSGINANTAFTAAARTAAPRLARVAQVLLDQLHWHEARAAQLRALTLANLVNAIDFAEVHEFAAARIRENLSKLVEGTP